MRSPPWKKRVMWNRRGYGDRGRCCVEAGSTFYRRDAVGAVAGNAKVGNRVILWTRWQALEYITSPNVERRALDLFNVGPVVAGAIGAWRTAAVLRLAAAIR